MPSQYAPYDALAPGLSAVVRHFSGGGGHDINEIVRFLRSNYPGLNIPRGFSAQKFGKATVLGELLSQIGQPTGLENLYGPEFQSRAVSSTMAQTGQPFQEAGRALTGGFLRSGQGGGGQLARGREQLATAQGQTQGNAISQLLMGLEGQRGQNIQNIEGIRTNRLAMLANFINGLMTQDTQASAAAQQGQAAQGAGIGQGVGGILGALIPLLGLLCVVAEELFGKDAEETHLARYWVRFLAPAWFRNGYAKHGPEIAERVRKDPEFAEAIRPLFLWFGREAAAVLEASAQEV